MKGLTFTPSFFLLPPLFPPAEKEYHVKRARQGIRISTERIGSMSQVGQEQQKEGMEDDRLCAPLSAENSLRYSELWVESLSETLEARKLDFSSLDPSPYISQTTATYTPELPSLWRNQNKGQQRTEERAEGAFSDSSFFQTEFKVPSNPWL